MSVRFVLGMGMVMGLIAGCGPVGSGTPTGGSVGARTPSPSVSPTSSPVPYVTAQPLGHPTVVPITTTLYDPASGCGSVHTTLLLPEAPPLCQESWQGFSLLSIPSSGYPASLGLPVTVNVAAGIPAAQGAAAAEAFLRTVMLVTWGASQNNPGLIAATDTQAFQAQDPLLDVWKPLPGEQVANAEVVSVPACSLPTSLSVVSLSNAGAGLLANEGVAPANREAIVATYSACPGLSIAVRGRSTLTTGFGNAVPASEIFAGTVAPLEPFLPVWMVSNAVECGAPHILAVCEGTV